MKSFDHQYGGQHAPPAEPIGQRAGQRATETVDRGKQSGREAGHRDTEPRLRSAKLTTNAMPNNDSAALIASMSHINGSAPVRIASAGR